MTTPSDGGAVPAFPGLVGIIEMVNGLDAAGDRPTVDVAVTVTIQGMIVSGVVISAREYMRRLGSQFAEAFAGSPIPEVGVELQERLAAMPGTVPRRRAPAQPAEGSDDLERVAPHFLHLKGVTILMGNRTVRMPLWEGRLAFVGGWSLASPTGPA